MAEEKEKEPRIVDGKDLLSVFNTPEGRMVLKYLIKSYHWVSSYTQGDPHETALNEGKRLVVIDLIDKMRASAPIITAKMLAEIELEGI